MRSTWWIIVRGLLGVVDGGCYIAGLWKGCVLWYLIDSR